MLAVPSWCGTLLLSSKGKGEKHNSSAARLLQGDPVRRKLLQTGMSHFVIHEGRGCLLISLLVIGHAMSFLE